MSWRPEVDEIRRREALAREMGGAGNIERQHAAGRLTVGDRIDRLLDRGPFHEIGALAGRAAYDQATMRTAELFAIEEIIDPPDTRRLLCDWAETAYRMLPADLRSKGRTLRA